MGTGKNNVEEGVAKSIRLYFQKHVFVKVGVKGRSRGTTVAEIVEAIEVFSCPCVDAIENQELSALM